MKKSVTDLKNPKTIDEIIQAFYVDEEKLNEERNTHLAFAKELAAVWLILLCIPGAEDCLKNQETIIMQEVSRAWLGRVEFHRNEKKIIAVSADGIRMNLLTGDVSEI